MRARIESFAFGSSRWWSVVVVAAAAAWVGMLWLLLGLVVGSKCKSSWVLRVVRYFF